MPTLKLTKRNIDSLKAAGTRYTAWDSDLRGFGLRITPTDERTYVIKYRADGVQRWFTIGRHGSPWTPEQAREEARRHLGDVARGLDPAGKRAEDRAAITFGELCELYLSEGVAHKKASTLRADRGRVELHLKPLLGRKRATTVARGDIERMQADVAAGKTKATPGEKRPSGSLASGGAGVAAQCVALVSTVMAFAVARKIRSDNPALGIKKQAVRKLQRFLSEAEFGQLADALNAEIAAGGNPYQVAAIRLLALTGARRSEIVMLKWAHVDFQRALLLLPDSKTREKAIVLSPPALAILAELPRVAGNEFVIAGDKPGGPYIALDKVWTRVRAAAELADVRLHDLRHSFASVGASASFGLPIIGRLLGHTQASTTARYAHLNDDPVRKAANSIGATIAAAMGGAVADTVTPLRRKGG